MPRYAAKVDRNQQYIVNACRKAGLSVYPLHTVGRGFPDLIVGGFDQRQMCSANLLVEIKTDEKQKLTEHEQEFYDNWRGPRIVAWEPEQVLRWFGLID